MDRFLNASFIRFSYYFCCILLGFVFLGAGMSKLYFEHRFVGLIGPVWLIERLEEYNLAVYGSFIAYSQIIIGYMLITLRFRLLGAIMLVPMLANILMITISQNWAGTPYVLSIFLMMNTLLLLKDYKRLLIIVNEQWYTPAKVQTRSVTGNLVWLSGLSISLLSIRVSFLNLPLAYCLVILSLVVSFLSFLVDRRLENQPKRNE